MIVRVRMVIKGDVQEAGYRAFIMRTAQKLKLKGYVENLPDGSVRVVCEGKRKAIDEFSKEIRLKNDMVNVESLRKHFAKPKGEFNRFEVKTSDLAYEMFQGYATAGKHFKMLGQKMDCVGEKVEDVGRKVDGVGEKVEDVGRKVDGVGKKVEDVGRKVDGVGVKVENVGEKVEGVGGKVDNLTAHTDEHFNRLDDKYGLVSETLISMNKEQAKTREELTRAVDNLNSLVNSVNILIHEHIEKEREKKR
jgi:acylphosphatase/uncharacterized protein YoxC